MYIKQYGIPRIEGDGSTCIFFSPSFCQTQHHLKHTDYEVTGNMSLAQQEVCEMVNTECLKAEHDHKIDK